MKELTVVYDLESCLPMYDFVQALVVAEHKRRLGGYDRIKMVIMPGKTIRLGYSKRWPSSEGDRRAMLDAIVFPMAKMLRNTHLVMPNRRVEVEGPDVIWFGKGAATVGGYFAALGDGVRPLDVGVKSAQRDPKLITMTLRECGKGRWIERDSNVNEWVYAGQELQRIGFRVIVLRDTRIAQMPLPGLTTDARASIDLVERARLYHYAALNLFVSNGPAWFAVACDEPLIIFRPTCEKAGKAATEESMARYGLIRGKPIPGSPPYQRLVWEGGDRACTILDHVHDVFKGGTHVKA